jgi:hypothetical protein
MLFGIQGRQRHLAVETHWVAAQLLVPLRKGDTNFERHGYNGIWGSQYASMHHIYMMQLQLAYAAFQRQPLHPRGRLQKLRF